MPHQNVMRTADNHCTKKRHLANSVLMVLILSLSGCESMMVMFGDNIRYSISGEVQDSTIPDAKNIPDAEVSLECPGTEKSIYQNRKGMTDQSGHFELSGYWELKGCKISFEHESYTTKTIEIDQSHLISSEDLSRAYEVNVRLKPKTN